MEEKISRYRQAAFLADEKISVSLGQRQLAQALKYVLISYILEFRARTVSGLFDKQKRRDLFFAAGLMFPLVLPTGILATIGQHLLNKFTPKDE